MRHPGSDYRPDIDGLRAVAVLSVLVYHASNALLPGGFVGVDIFFVISGFLITRNIWVDLQAGRFRLADFYLRRVRRIAPAFMLVTAATLAAGTLLLLPADLARLGRSAAWASLSGANVYFWKYLDTSYFAPASDQEPLLHMWSLGVEEQFYLLWPAVLMGCSMARRARPAAMLAIVAICVASFGLAEATNASAQKFSYYMLPTRAGELMLGALLALFGQRRIEQLVPARLRSVVAETVAVAGFALIAFSLWKLDDTSPFPGLNALYPCLGALLVMLSGQLDSRATRVLLTPRPIVFIGLISYSLYLWHWPIFAFIRYFDGEVRPLQALVAILAMLVLATATYRFVELPARRMRARPLMQVVTLLAAPVSVVFLTSALIVRSGGIEADAGAAQQAESASWDLDEQTAAASRNVFPCMDARTSLAQALRNPHCVLGDPAEKGRPGVFVWGDSNAGHFLGTLAVVGEQGNFAFRYASLSTCPPLFGEREFGSLAARARCNAFREGIRQHLSRAGYRTVVLAAQWAVHDHIPNLRSALEATISELRHNGQRVVMVGQIPGFPGYNRECERREARIGSASCAVRASRADAPAFPISTYMAELARDHAGVAFVDAHDALCQGGRCSPYLDGRPIYFNPTHLSAAGSYQLGRKIMSGPGRGIWLTAFSDGRLPATEPAIATAPDAPPRTIAGYAPGFPYWLRSQRHGSTGRGQFQHVVIAEYLDADAVAIAHDLDTGLTALGFTVQGPIKDRDAVRYVARRSSLSLTVVIHAKPKIRLVAPGARGLVSFAWRDRQAF